MKDFLRDDLIYEEIPSKPQEKDPYHHHSYDFTYFCRYGHQYLIYLPCKFLSKLSSWRKYGSKIPYLPTIWAYVQNFVVFIFGMLSLLVFKSLFLVARATLWYRNSQTNKDTHNYLKYGPVYSCMVLWSRMVLFVPVWSRMVPCGPVWSLMVLYNPVWSRMIPYGPLWSRLVPYGPLWSRMILSQEKWI